MNKTSLWSTELFLDQKEYQGVDMHLKYFLILSHPNCNIIL